MANPTVVIATEDPGDESVRETRRLLARHPDAAIVVVSAHANVEQAVKCLRSGAIHYLPFRGHEDGPLRDALDEALRYQQAPRLETYRIHRELDSLIIGSCAEVRALKQRILAIGDSDARVLIQGESGTGKELIAQAIHATSARRNKPFVAVNCAAFPDTLLEAELFGHERGAFTGATQRRLGRLHAAHGGTLLLDEVSELSPRAQAKLLRVLETERYEPLGSNRSERMDVRILSASNADLASAVRRGTFREDLYYRLKVFQLAAPPLRTRGHDLEALVERFIASACPPDRSQPTLTVRAWLALRSYNYPGNVRELRHAIEHAVVLAGAGPIDLQHLPEDLVRNRDLPAPGDAACPSMARAVQDFEHDYAQYVVRHLAGGKRTRAAELLQISRKTLWEKLRRGPS